LILGASYRYILFANEHSMTFLFMVCNRNEINHAGQLLFK